MNFICIKSYSFLIFCSVLSCLGCAAPETVERIAISNVTVIAGDGSPPRAAQTVVLAAGRIVAVGGSAEVPIEPDMEIIDGSDAYLLPGFVDTHAHFALGPVSINFEGADPVMAMERIDTVVPATAKALLQHGVTTARDPGGIAEQAVAARQRIASGQLLGPRLQVAGEVITATRFDNLAAAVDSEASTRAEVGRQAALGVDWIKLYVELEPNLVRAAIDEAHRHGLRVTGHLQATTWTEAARAGIDSLVHIMPGSPQLLPERARAEYTASMTTSLFMLRWFDLVEHDSPQIEEMIEALLANQVSVDPTLVVLHSMANGDDAVYTNNPALDLVAPELVRNWREFFHFNIGWSPEDFEQAQKLYPEVAKFTKLLFDRGVLLTAGTDANNPWIVPGDSFHRELELLVDAGITPLEVLSIATYNGAKALGLDGEVGTIEAGKRADLVLLLNDPSETISATRDIAWVMKDGVRYNHPD